MITAERVALRGQADVLQDLAEKLRQHAQRKDEKLEIENLIGDLDDCRATLQAMHDDAWPEG